jgi:hypothetical protein
MIGDILRWTPGSKFTDALPDEYKSALKVPNEKNTRYADYSA